MARALLFTLAFLIVRADLVLAESAANPPARMTFEIDCSDDDQVRKVICGLSSAILNKDCSSIKTGNSKMVCDSVVNSAAGGKGFNEYYHLMYICGADWIPIVAKECATRSAGLSAEYKKTLADYLSAKVPYHWAQKQIDLENATDKLRLCTRNQVTNLIVNNESETANAIAAAVIALCRRELAKAAQALDAAISRGPPCLEGSSRCNNAEKSLTEPMLSALAARVMYLRAQGKPKGAN
jgi:hypothetical protein